MTTITEQLKAIEADMMHGRHDCALQKMQLLLGGPVSVIGPGPLTFRRLREANVEGQEYFRKPGFTPWSLGDWMTALVGEIGEAANILKKVRREDFTIDEARDNIADELADAQVYLDHLARAAGIDLEAAVIRKWNAVHARRNSPLRIGAEPETVQIAGAQP